LKFLQAFLLLLQLRLHRFQLFLFRSCSSFHWTQFENAAAAGKLDGVRQFGDLVLKGNKVVFLRLDLGLPVFRREGFPS